MPKKPQSQPTEEVTRITTRLNGTEKGQIDAAILAAMQAGLGVLAYTDVLRVGLARVAKGGEITKKEIEALRATDARRAH